MSAKQLVRLAIGLGVLLLLWGAAALIRDRESGSAGGGFALPRLARGDVGSVRIVRTSDTTLLARRDSSTWTVNGLPAAAGAPEKLLPAPPDTTLAAELVAERSASHAGLGIDSASGTRVRVAGEESLLADLIVGQRTPDLTGGYLRRAGDSAVYLVRGRLTELLSRTPDDWRDRKIARVAPDSVARIEVRRGSRSYALRRGERGWALGARAPADSAAVADMLAALRQVDASGFATPAQADSAGFSPADRRTTLLQADGTALLVLAFDSTAGGFWVRADSGATVYRVDSFTADRLAPAESSVRASSR
ncbi:MAG: DUF4340 domain-containing protein [Gemmatimonadales bacterium]